MRKYYFFLSIAVTYSLLLIGCAKKEEKLLEITSRIQYDVPIRNDDPQADWWINNLEGSKREPFINRIMEAAKNGDIRAYDYFNLPLTPQQVKAIGNDTIYSTLIRTTPPYDEFDTMIIQTLDYRDIVKIRFLEKWVWDPKTLIMKKEILGIAPVTMKKIGNETYNHPLFWIYYENKVPTR